MGKQIFEILLDIVFCWSLQKKNIYRNASNKRPGRFIKFFGLEGGCSFKVGGGRLFHIRKYDKNMLSTVLRLMIRFAEILEKELVKELFPAVALKFKKKGLYRKFPVYNE